jgi:hypothetical protein
MHSFFNSRGEKWFSTTQLSVDFFLFAITFAIIFVEEVLNLVPIRLVILEMYAISYFFFFTIRLRLIGVKMHQLKFFF